MSGDSFDLAAALAARGLVHGVGDFQGRWEQRHPFSIPGPIYVGEDDSCGCGPVQAPGNVLLGEGYSGEFVFKQPASRTELDAVLTAAEVNPMCCYGIDGDEHWTEALVWSWWRGMEPVLHGRPQNREEAAWITFMRHDAENYLRGYVAFLMRR